MMRFLRKHAHLLALIAVSSVVFVILEIRHPLYFLQDDNYNGYLSSFVYVARSLFKGGQLSFYNFHQLLGIPTFALGQHGVLNPLTYISVALSAAFTGTYYWTIEIYAFICIITGIIGMFILLKHIKVNPLAAVFGSLVWGFSNFTFLVGYAWCTILSIVMCLPFMVYFAVRLLETPKIKWVLALTVVRLLSFSFGHAQFFAYSCLAEFLFVVCFVYIQFRRGEGVAQFIKFYLFSYICTLFLSLPLLLPYFHQTQISASRSEAISFDEFVFRTSWKDYLLGLLSPNSGPWPWIRSISFIGIIPVVLWFVCIKRSVFHALRTAYERFLARIESIVRGTAHEIDRQRDPLYSWQVVSLLLSLFFVLLVNGNDIITNLLYVTPIFNKFRWVFREIQFVNFFAAIAASVVLHEIVKTSSKKTLIFLLVIAIQIGGSLYALGFDADFGMFPTRQEAVPHSSELVEMIDDQKVVSVGFDENVAGLIPAQALLSNFATFFGKYHINGYEMLLTGKQMDAVFNMYARGGLPLYNWNSSRYTDEEMLSIMAQMREWGIRWYMTSNRYTYPDGHELLVKSKNNFATLYEDPGANPIFYSANEVSIVTDYEIGYNDIMVKVDQAKADDLFINFFHNPFFVATVDGEVVELGKTTLGQMTVQVPAGEHEIWLRYRDPYFVMGCVISGGFLLLLALGIMLGKVGVWKRLTKQFVQR